MATVRDELLPLPIDEASRRRIETLKGADEVRLKDTLPSGYSGAKVFLADLIREGVNQGVCVVKVASDLDAEIENHAEALQSKIGNRVPAIVEVGQSTKHFCCVAYKLAGASLLNSRPLATLLQTDNAAASASLSELLMLLRGWNETPQIEQLSASAVVADVVAAGNGIRQRAVARFTESSGPAALTSRAVIFEGNNVVMPNVIACLQQDAWPVSRALSVGCGSIHGDLHPGNVLCVKSKERYDIHLIDFSSYRKSACLCADTSYLELAVLLNDFDVATNAGRREWLRVAEYLAGQKRGADVKPSFSVRATGLIALTAVIREHIEAAATEANQQDDFRLASLLASVGAGIRLFAVMRDDYRALAALAFASYHLAALYQVLELEMPTAGGVTSIPWVESGSAPAEPEKVTAFDVLRREIAHLLPSARVVLCLGPESLEEVGSTGECAVWAQLGTPQPNSDDVLASWDKVALDPLDTKAKLKVFDSLSNTDEQMSRTLAPLARPHWAAVFDFGVSTSLVSCVTVHSGRSVLPLTGQDAWRIELGADLPLPWVFLRGNVAGLSEVKLGLRDWRLPQSTTARLAFYQRVAERLSPPAAIIFSGFDRGTLRRAFDEVVGSFNNQVPAYVVSTDSEIVREYADQASSVLPLTFKDLLLFLEHDLPSPAPPTPEDRYVLRVRSPEGGVQPIPLPASDFETMCQSFDLLYEHVASDRNPTGRVPGDFYRGYPISYKELALAYDVRRHNQTACLQAIVADLDSNNTRRYVLEGEPGCGLSTFASRLAWNAYFEANHPSLLIRRSGPALLDNITRLHDKLHRAIFIVAEDEFIQEDDVDRLFEQMQARNIPFVLLWVERVKEPSSSEPWILSDHLTGREVHDLRQKISPLLDEKQGQALAQLDDTTLFLNLLTAFEENFVRLDRYVNECLEGASTEQTALVQAIAFIGRYGPGVLVSPPLIAVVAAVTVSNLHASLASFEDRLILKEGSDSDARWRIRHELIGDHLLARSLGYAK